MKIRQIQKEDNVVTFNVKADAQDVAKALQLAQEGFARSMGLEPEPGKTVAQVAQEKMGIRDLDQIVANSAIEMLVSMALDKKNLIPAFRPTPKVSSQLKRGQEFSFTLEVTLRPEYELSSYEPVEVEVQRFHVDEAAVEAELEQMANEYTAYLPDPDADPSREVAKGDFVKIAIKATEGGKEFRGLSTTGRTYAVGAGHMPEGFDSQVQGMKVGEKKAFQFEAPSFDDDFNEVTVTVDAEVEILEMLHETRPELDDEWVQKNMPWLKNAEEMRKSIRKTLEMQSREAYDSYVRQKVADAWARRFEGKISNEVYEAMNRQLMDNLRMEMQQQGRDWDEFVQENGGEQQLTMLVMMQAREILAQGYALDAIFRHFNLTIGEEDILAVCRSMNSKADPKQLHQEIVRQGQGFALRESVERYKANQYALEHAKITYFD